MGILFVKRYNFPASGICDGAAAVIIASEDAVTKHGLTPLARIVGYGVAGCEPTIMGIGPVPAIGAMLDKTGVSLGEVDQVSRTVPKYFF